jgi:hypothetical protein
MSSFPLPIPSILVSGERPYIYIAVGLPFRHELPATTHTISLVRREMNQGQLISVYHTSLWCRVRDVMQRGFDA